MVYIDSDINNVSTNRTHIIIELIYIISIFVETYIKWRTIVELLSNIIYQLECKC